MSKETNEYTKLYSPPCPIDDDGNFLDTKQFWTELHNYIQTGLENEKAFLRSQRAFSLAENSMLGLYGVSTAKEYKGLSRLKVNKSRRQTREAIANQSDIRQNWSVRTTVTSDENMVAQAQELDKLSQNWWSELFVDRVVKGAQQYAGGYGTGYIFQWPDINPITGEIDIIPKYLDYKSVLVGHIENDNNIENCPRVDIRLEMPLPIAHEKYPDHVEMIRPDTEVPSRMARNWDTTRKVFRGIVDYTKKRKKTLSSSVSNPFPSVNIIMSFIKDNTVNETGITIPMGEPGSHWYYEVPSYYDKNGEINRVGTNTFKQGYVDANGNAIEPEVMMNMQDTSGLEPKQVEIKRFVTKRDCKLYPYRRLVISCSNGIIYDGPPQWGCGLPPVTQFYFDKIAGEFLCFPPTMDSQIIEGPVNNILQSMEDAVVGRINPPIGVDSSVPESIANQIKALGFRGLIGKVFQYPVMKIQKAIVMLVPEGYFQIDSKAFELIAYLQEVQDYLAGTKDFTSQTKLKQMPSDDSQEAMLQNIGILATDQARELERCFMSMGRIWLSYSSQVYTLAKKLRITGTDALKLVEPDFDPIKIAPAILENDARPLWKRQREHMKNFSIYVAPNSVQQQQSYKKKLALLQIKNMQVAISDRMIYDAFVGDDNYGKVKTEFFAEQKEKAEAAAKIQAEVQKIMQALNPQGQPSGNGNGNGQQNSSMIDQVVAALVQQNNIGRPPTNDAPAHLEEKNKGGISRTTLATS